MPPQASSRARSSGFGGPRGTSVERLMPAAPEQVFAVLADGRLYDRWVVGTKRVRAVDPTWPAPGSRIHHRVGVGPVVVADITEVLEVQAPRRLLLEARARVVRAHVEIVLASQPEGTRVSLNESVVRPGPLTWLASVVSPALRWRNRESLRRLAGLAVSVAGNR